MIKYLVMDVDGTLTDGKIYMGPNGEAMKAFSVKDGYVMTHILSPHGIVPIVITARTSSIVEHRCTELGITHVVQGRRDKLAALIEIIGEDSLGNCAFFGDDILDLKCMIPIQKAGGIAACPADAVLEVKGKVDYVCESQAGNGALREFAEWLVNQVSEKLTTDEEVAQAVAFLQGLTITEDDIGRHEVRPGFFYLVQSYTTRSEEFCELESHKKYIDIQMIIKGSEAMDICDILRLQPSDQYDETKDVMHWKIPNRMARTVLNQGDYIILNPENAHRGCINVMGEEVILKLVGKLALKKPG